jgi:hypothetical protein
MVALGKITHWSRSEIRAMSPEVFTSYLDAAAVEKTASGG